jgi:succinate dehydrogenase/fumarate reductase flavoprotein subunit
MARCAAPLARNGAESVYPLRERMRDLMWRNAGLIRSEALLTAAAAELAELRERLGRASCPAGRSYNLPWMDWLSLENSLQVCEVIVRSARARRESRGSHYRSDFPALDNAGFLGNFRLSKDAPAPTLRPAVLSRLKPQARQDNRAGTVPHPPPA